MTRKAAAWTAHQLMALAASEPDLGPKPRGPSPWLGRWREGCTTDVVYRWLADPVRCRFWHARDAVISGTGCSGKAVDWALLFLRSQKAVDLTTDPRCGRYHRYRAAAGFEPRKPREHADA